MSRSAVLSVLFAVSAAVGVPVVRAQTPPAQAVPGPLPPDIVSAVRAKYVVEGMETRYVDGLVDLNGDGRDEWLVYVVGPAACGTGGCPTLVFTPDTSGHYKLASTIGLTRPPIRVSTAVFRGWKNLVMQVTGGGMKGGDVEVLYNGTRYPTNPSVRSAFVKPATGAGAKIVIDTFKDFNATKPLPSGGREIRRPAGRRHDS